MPLNFARTALLLAMLTGIFVALGYLVGGPAGMVIAFVIAVAMNAFSYWNSDKIVLKMYGAREVDADSAPDYYALVRELAANAELPMPRVFIMDNAQPNAFATGRNPENAAVAASTGLLEMLSREEVAGVMAHELAHIKNRDTLTMSIAATIGGAISMIAQYLQFSLLFGGRRGGLGWIGTLAAIFLAPLAAMLVQMAISRSREYQADRLGARICRNPLWLASALRKIQGAARRIPNEAAERAPATAHLFIINPLTGRGMDALFSTHPSTENRIAELQDFAREWGQGTAPVGTAPVGTAPVGDGPMRRAQAGEPGPWGRTSSPSADGASDSSWPDDGRSEDGPGSGSRGPWG